MVKFTVPLSDILGSAYYRYELSSSNYNPNINSTITITCTCKNILGNPISNKTLELYQNDTSKGTATTNANGIATWTLTMSDWGTQEIKVENSTLSLQVSGGSESHSFTPTNVSNASNITFWKQGNTIQFNWIDDSVSVTSTTSNTIKILGNIPSKFRPKTQQWCTQAYGLGNANSRQTSLCIKINGDVELHCFWSNTSAQNISCVFTGVYILQ